MTTHKGTAARAAGGALAGVTYVFPPGRAGSGIQLGWNAQGGISALARDGAVDDH